MKLIVLSDVHGNLCHCNNVAIENPNVPIIQLGDLGVGFVPKEVIERLPSNFYFFPGNHDNRQVAVTMKNCLGHYGNIALGFNHHCFFVSGADSKDKDIRTPGVNWWPDEELTYAQGEQCLLDWEKSDAQVIISHDLPQHIAQLYYLIYDKSRTRQLLQLMVEIRKPKLVVYGHHHKPFRKVHDGVEYIGLKIDETITLDISKDNVIVTP